MLRIGTWNIPRLGTQKSSDYAKIAAVIDHAFDLLVLVGIAQTQHGHPGYDKVVAALGSTWDGFITDRPRPNRSRSAEHYAMLWRKGVVRPCADWNGLVYHPDNDGSASATGDDLFEREPAFGCFEARSSEDIVGMDWLIGAYRAPTLKVGRTEVQSEVARLQEVFDLIAQAREGERDLLLAGTFSLSDEEFPEGLAFSPLVTTRPVDLLEGEHPFPGTLYDHLVVADAKATAEFRSARAVDLRKLPTERQLSDEVLATHLPIVARFDVSGPDDD